MAVSYRQRETVPRDVSERLKAYDTLTQTLLHTRGISDAETAERFFARDYIAGLHDPFLMKDMDVAVSRILSALKEKEHITIYSDYDCDGIPGAALFYDFLTAIGCTHFDNYIPHRHEEGYGLNIPAIDVLIARGTKLIITVDSGITDTEQVAHAMSRGIDVIVTDHHEPGPVLPPALAVLNPKRSDNTYPFRELCGSGVAFKLIQALLARGGFALPHGYEKWFLDVVGLATIADMVPLVDENRLFAHYGLLVMKKGRRVGLQHLFRVMRMQASQVTEDDIGFMIGPRINAASRMGKPEDAFKLLTARNDADAGAYARHLDHINNERKGVVGAMVKEVKKKLARRDTIDPVLTLGDPSWRPALVGLAAHSLMEEYDRPVFLWGRDGRGVLKGSCRSNGEVSVVELMHLAHETFIEYGGHHASGGFAVKEECIHTLGEVLNSALALLGSVSIPKESCPIDAELQIADVTQSLVSTLNRFAPYGIGNKKPLFLFRGVSPLRVEMFGKEKGHTKTFFAHPRGQLSAIGFFRKPDEFIAPLMEGGAVDLLAHIEESTFGGRKEIRLRIVEIVSVGTC